MSDLQRLIKTLQEAQAAIEQHEEMKHEIYILKHKLNAIEKEGYESFNHQKYLVLIKQKEDEKEFEVKKFRQENARSKEEAKREIRTLEESQTQLLKKVMDLENENNRLRIGLDEIKEKYSRQKHRADCLEHSLTRNCIAIPDKFKEAK